MKNFVRNIRTYITILIIALFPPAYFSQSQPYVILISFDGFRWDYINRNITPNISSLIEQGVEALSLKPVFPSKTFPNHLSIITGMYPENHGIIFNEFDDSFTDTHYDIRDSVEVTESRWYRGEAFWETAKRQGIITASYFWPGSEINLEYRRPDYFHHYEHERPYPDRINGVLNWLKLPYSKRPHFITTYFDLTDGIGHRFGPNSPEIDIAIASLDSTLGSMLSGLSEIQMRDSVNIILVSDHGMTEVSVDRIINVEEMLTNYNINYSNYGPLMMISPKDDNVEEVYTLLKINENHYKVYYREEIPSYYHFSHNPLISKILLVADIGWSLIFNENLKW